MKHGLSKCTGMDIQKLDDGTFMSTSHHEHMPGGNAVKGEVPFMSHKSKKYSHANVQDLLGHVGKMMGGKSSAEESGE